MLNLQKKIINFIRFHKIKPICGKLKSKEALKILIDIHRLWNQQFSGAFEHVLFRMIVNFISVIFFSTKFLSNNYWLQRVALNSAIYIHRLRI